jgi:hypothetical protein
MHSFVYSGKNNRRKKNRSENVWQNKRPFVKRRRKQRKPNLNENSLKHSFVYSGENNRRFVNRRKKNRGENVWQHKRPFVKRRRR